MNKKRGCLKLLLCKKKIMFNIIFFYCSMRNNVNFYVCFSNRTKIISKTSKLGKIISIVILFPKV